MSKQLRPTRLVIDDRALGDNVLTLRRRIRNVTRMMAVVKANAYGHGLVETGRIALDCGADALAVATVEEGVRLRESRMLAPILVMGGGTPEGAAACVGRHLSLALYDPTALNALQKQAKKLDTVAHAHLKIDTGMNRVGLLGEAQIADMLRRMEKCPNVKLEGLFTHFSDAPCPEFTAEQNARFRRAINQVRAAGHSPMIHAAASDAMLSDETLWYDMVRPGVAIYGASVRHLCEGLLPVQQLTTKPVRLTAIPEGEWVGYGREFTARRETRIMTLPIGYGDGYPRLLGGKAAVLVRGMRAPVIGRVCMDMLMVDVTDVPGAQMGDEVVLLGQQGDQRITPDELAVLCGTIPYEIMLGFTERVPMEHAVEG